MNVELDEAQVRGIIWLMEDKVSEKVMALPQFANMRAAKETLQRALATLETPDVDPTPEHLLKQGIRSGKAVDPSTPKIK